MAKLCTLGCMYDAELCDQIVRRFCAARHLPPRFATAATNHYLPLATWIHNQWRAQRNRVFAINGAQGSGKSTLAALLRELFAERFNLSAVCLSIDDFYLPIAARQRLAQTMHPLLATRGVPGTHDTNLGMAIIDRLLELETGQTLALPTFIKALDERAPQPQWPVVQGPVDLILFEGWCVGSRAQPTSDLVAPTNKLEALHDPQCTWREFVNEQLKSDYADWFSRIERLIFLAAPDFNAVYDWRLQQEQENVQAYPNSANRMMGPADLKRFLQHYERLTRANLVQLPALADVLFHLDANHGIISSEYRQLDI